MMMTEENTRIHVEQWDWGRFDIVSCANEEGINMTDKINRRDSDWALGKLSTCNSHHQDLE